MWRFIFLALLAAVLFPAPRTSAEEATPENIIYTALRPTNWDIYLFDKSGAKPRRLTTDVHLDYNAAFSPDGRRVVFCSERSGLPELWSIDLNDKKPAPQRITEGPGMKDAPALSPDGKRLAFVATRDGNAEIYIAPFRADGTLEMSAAKNLTNDPAGDFNPAFSPDGKHIAFASDRDGYKASEVYIMRSDGSDVRRLTEAGGWDGSPAWSADGSRVLFYSERDGRPRLYSIEPDRSDARPVSPSGEQALSPATGPDSQVLYSGRHKGRWAILSVAQEDGEAKPVSDGQRDYWAPDYHRESDRIVCHGAGPAAKQPFRGRPPGRFLVNGRQQAELSDRKLRLWAVRGYFPSVGGDGREIATDERFEAVVISRLDGSNLRKVFQPEQGRAWRPTWSKDGKWLACTVGQTFAQPDAEVDIWRFRADGSEAENLTPESSGNDGFPDFSPDGKQIVFRSGRDGNHELYVMNADGSDTRRLTENDAVDTMPAFAPDGKRIAFTSNRDGNYEVYILTLAEDGSVASTERITDSPTRDTHPKFSPDGRWLVFASERGGMNDESPLIPVFNPQPYGDIFVIRLEDRKVARLTHNKWEDGTPAWGPALDAAAASE